MTPDVTPDQHPQDGDALLTLQDAVLTLDGNSGPVEILHEISLEVRKGETLALVGPSGSGKSSLLMLMGGLEQATAGKITALGQDLTAMDEDALARFRRAHMGVVFQSFHLIPTMTALENVATPLELMGVRDAFQRAEAELKAVGLAHRADHLPAQMSGGEQQRVALARALAPRPALILADEPTGNLDQTNGKAVMDLLFSLRDRHGATLVMVTHAPELAARCDRVIALRDGRILPDDSAQEAAE
jgi:putative ABC transport system ATP-binding protein